MQSVKQIPASLAMVGGGGRVGWKRRCRSEKDKERRRSNCLLSNKLSTLIESCHVSADLGYEICFFFLFSSCRRFSLRTPFDQRLSVS